MLFSFWVAARYRSHACFLYWKNGARKIECFGGDLKLYGPEGRGAEVVFSTEMTQESMGINMGDEGMKCEKKREWEFS